MAGFVSVPVIPTFEGMSKAFTERLVKPARQAGQTAGKEISQGLGSSVDSLERQVAASSKKLEAFERERDAAASNREQKQQRLQAATLELAAAEEKYNAAVEKGESGTSELARVHKAKANLTKANQDLTKAEIDVRVAEEKHADQLKDLDSTTKRYDDAQDKLADQLGITKKELKELDGGFSQFDATMDTASRNAEGFVSKLGTFLKPLGKLGGLAVGLAGINSVAGTLQAGFDKVTSIEDTTASLGILMGSAEKATKVMDQLQESNQGTPYSFDAWADAGKNLIAFGVDADKVSEIVTGLGEAASASGKGEDALNSMAGAFGKAAASGKISMDTINSLAEGGVQGLAIMANEYGVTTEEMQKMISKGAVDASKGIDILTKGILEGSSGIAGEISSMSGVMGEMAETTSGRITNMKAAFNNAAKSVFEEINPLIGDAALKLTDWTYAGIGLFKDHVVPAAQQAIDMARRIIDDLSPALTKVRDMLESIVSGLVSTGQWLGDVAGWLVKHKDYVEALAVGVGVLVGAYKLWALHQKIITGGGLIKYLTTAIKKTKAWTAATKLQAAAQRALNLVMKANMIGIVITAITAVVAALTYFFTKTEAGKRMWQSFMDTLAAAGEWLQVNVIDKFDGAWERLKEGFFDSMERAGQRLSDKWAEFTGWIVDNWNGFVDSLHAGQEWVQTHVFDPIMDGIAAVGDWFSARLDDIATAWQWWKDTLATVWNWVKEYVFDPIGNSLEAVANNFRIAVDNIASIWDGLREAAANPVRFVVNTVWNNGILKAIEAVTKFIPGVEAPSPVSIAFASGGILPGYTPGVDPYEFLEPRTGMRLGLSGGEAILRPEATRALGEDWVNNVNAAARAGGVAGVQNILGHAHFARGGVIDLGDYASGGFINIAGSGALTDVTRSQAAFVAKFFPGQFALTSALRFTDNGHHAHGQATDWQAQDGHFATQMPTPWSKALANAIYTNFRNSAELIHWPLDGWQNLKDGAPLDYGPATNAQHANHVHWATRSPLQFDGDDIVLADVPEGGARSGWSLSSIVKSAFDKVIDKITPWGSDETWFDQLPGAFLKSAVDSVWEFIAGKSKDSSVAFTEPAGEGVGRWADAATEALQRMGYGPEHLDAMLEQIRIESGGDPNAINNWDINAVNGVPSGGLLQVIEPTYRDVRNRWPEAFEGLPDDRFHPLTNLVAGVGAVKRDWGGPAGRWPTTAGYAAGGIFDPATHVGVYDTGGVLPPGGIAVNMSPFDEVVVNGPKVEAIDRLAANVGVLVNEFRATGDVNALLAGMRAIADDATGALVEQLQRIADPQTFEGIVTRSLISEAGGIASMLGMDHTATAVSTLMKAEADLLEVREAQAERAKDIADREKELKRMRDELAKLEKGETEMSVQDKRKLEDAEKALADARKEAGKAGQASAEAAREAAEAEDGLGKSRKKSAAAAENRVEKSNDKVAKAEEKLSRVREDLGIKAEQDEEKRAEQIEKLREDIAKSETDLVNARRESARSLDVTLFELAPQISQGLSAAASQVVGLASKAGAAAPALQAVAGGLSSAAAAAGPAGMSIGMAVQAVKSVIEVGKMLYQMVDAVVEWVHKARVAARQALADVFGAFAQWMHLVFDLQANVATLQQQLVRGLIEQRQAEMALRVAAHDRRVAEAQGALEVAEARKALDAEIRRGATIAQLKLMGLHEDWDTYKSFEALAAQGALEKWSDAAISGMFTYEAARAKAAQADMQARLEQVKAAAEVAAAERQNVRNQQDLLKAQERLIRMSAKVAGIDLVGATGLDEAAKLMVEMTELQNAMSKNLLGRAGQAMGIENSYTRALAGEQAQYAALERALHQVLNEAGVTVSQERLDQLLKVMEKGARRGLDAASVLRGELPELAAAEGMLRANEALGAVDAARDKMDDTDRQVEDFRAEVDLWEKTAPLESQIKGLEYAVGALNAASAAWADGNEQLRGEYLQVARENHRAAQDLGVSWKLDPKYATEQVREQIRREVHIYTDGKRVYEADDLERAVESVLQGTNTTLVKHRTSSEVARSRREEVFS